MRHAIPFLLALLLLLVAMALPSAVRTSGAELPPAPAPLADERFRAVALGALEDVVPVAPEATTPVQEPRRRPLVASWYRDRLRPSDALYAAMPGYRFGDPIRWVAVTSFVDGVSRSVTVPVVDFCQCYVGTRDERTVDLSPAAFAMLAPLGVGLVTVEVEELR